MNGLADYLEMNVGKQRDEIDYDVSESNTIAYFIATALYRIIIRHIG